MPRWKPDAAARLMAAAMTEFEKHGYEATTVAQIAAAADLTKRTFFRYFTDKREVLFNGSDALEQCWVEAVAAAPGDVEPLAAATAGFDPVAEMFLERHALARTRARIIASNPELQERELIKLQRLAGSITSALDARGVCGEAALLAAQASVTVFHVAFARWVEQDDPAALRGLMDEALDALRAVTAA